MFLRVACLLVVLTLVSAGDPVEDSSNAIKIKALKPGKGSKSGDTLRVKCTIDRSKTDLESVTKLEIFATGVGEEDYELVASYSGDSVTYGKRESDVTAEGEIRAKRKKKSKLQVTWASADNGYCMMYKCVVTGPNGGSETEAVYQVYKMKAKSGESSCTAQKNEEALQELEAQVKECKAALAPKESALSKLEAIDGTKYHLSSVDKGRVYIALRASAAFNIQANNEACKAMGGYLVEFDDEAEQQFVGNFVRTFGRAWYFTGANDVDSEGNFVYYNSKKPMTGIKWRPREPNQWGGNEDCVDVNYIGLNDIGCGATGRYV